ncbi:MAG TPA: HlyD family efflux transporter periplasmic adaptor subunit [Methylococcaceae bacterium]|jgi:cobalt-zinc-cadmium efflux system membrane fusion protein|nr:HlyD family efflux transporter periplasmic adaptor subunit [Methylococcaceae bacterium]HIA45842.1 HlyD family efflux transporter periplasmic adaptor subunit [Methylococcaceae bacterium]HIN68826.1 HlyD family efflux transporter periplasmic adaptor subunit [Methylococcales bacterium]HIO13521.1 HlyD family efflux transporter periplasmic adaptor subunit [Methylococcales bacterium]HIO44541.1 HlyD family efflux transporter periplasmic adaptor subunit [Methylococcales bacterium]
MKILLPAFSSIFTLFLLLTVTPLFADKTPVDQAPKKTPQKGPHQGRLLTDNDFAIELAIYERGIPPEFRVWVTDKGHSVNLHDVSLNITLTRLDGTQNEINFTPQKDFLRGDSLIYEPHSFVILVVAHYRDISHRWQYDSFEGRTKIHADLAKTLAIETAIAQPRILKKTISAYGKLTTHPENFREIRSRFEGTIKSVKVSLGQQVKKGQLLLTIKRNLGLELFKIRAPINGVIHHRNANSGEQTNNRILFTLIDDSILISELAIFPENQHKIALGNKVSLFLHGSNQPITGVITQIDTVTQANQSVIVRTQHNNNNNQLIAGRFIRGAIEIAEHKAPLAVKRSGLQSFRDLTVVFVKIGETYEVRMLQLGLITHDWAEVLSGLKPNAEYVSKNSYIIKADIEKSGASHDH